MDLIPENPIKVKNNTKSKVSVPLIIVIVLMVILIIVAVIVWMYVQKLQTELFKVKIDEVSNSKATNEDGLFLIQDGKVYTSISNICPYLAYTYYPGGYKQYSEDKTKCYVNNSKEIVTFASGSNEIIKYPRKWRCTTTNI